MNTIVKREDFIDEIAYTVKTDKGLVCFATGIDTSYRFSKSINYELLDEVGEEANSTNMKNFLVFENFLAIADFEKLYENLVKDFIVRDEKSMELKSKIHLLLIMLENKGKSKEELIEVRDELLSFWKLYDSIISAKNEIRLYESRDLSHMVSIWEERLKEFEKNFEDGRSHIDSYFESKYNVPNIKLYFFGN